MIAIKIKYNINSKIGECVYLGENEQRSSEKKLNPEEAFNSSINYKYATAN